MRTEDYDVVCPGTNGLHSHEDERHEMLPFRVDRVVAGDAARIPKNDVRLFPSMKVRK